MCDSQEAQGTIPGVLASEVRDNNVIWREAPLCSLTIKFLTPLWSVLLCSVLQEACGVRFHAAARAVCRNVLLTVLSRTLQDACRSK